MSATSAEPRLRVWWVTEGVPPGHRDVQAWGEAAKVEALLALLRTSPGFVGASPARAYRGGWVVRVRLREQQPALPASPGAVVKPSWLADLARRCGPGVVWAGVVVAGVAIVLWAGWRTATSAADWAGDHSGQLIGVALLGLAGGLWWLLRRLRRPSRGCPGVAHCGGCNGHG